MDELLREFLTETSEHLDVVDIELVRFEQDPNNTTILQNIFRLVHTIKGTCGFLGLPRLETLAHAAESLMGKFRDGMPVTSDAVSLILATIDRIKLILGELERTAAEPPGLDEDLIEGLERLGSTGEVDIRAANDASGGRPAPSPEDARRDAPAHDEMASPDGPPQSPAREDEARRAVAEVEEARAPRVQTIRVTVNTLEHLMTMVSELVLTRNQLLEIARRQDDTAFKVPLQRLSHVTAELQEGVMKTRMQPIGSAWQKLPRVVRGLATELGKQIDLVMQGAETELDRQVLEIIKDPLTHMVRNSADHGIESPAERVARGKPERGTIRLGAYHEGGTITIEVSDDGRGLDYRRIRRTVIERGLAAEIDVDRMSDAQVAKFIFHPGFTTTSSVTAVSGRGVGMDVVKSNLELIGGTIDIHSEFGRGTTFTIKIPLTLAIIAALIVSARGQRFAIPQVAVLELVRVRPGSDHEIEHIDDTPVLRLRDRLLPVVPLAALLQLDVGHQGANDDGFIVITQVGRQRFGILVDGVFHTEEIVVKPMSRRLRHLSLFSGNTILGDGAVVLIIDPNGVSRTVGVSVGERAMFTDEVAEAPAPEEEEEKEAVTLLVFRAGGDGLKAVPLSVVTRLEEVDASKIERVGGRILLQYRGRLMPLVPADPAVRVRTEGAQPIVVFSDGDRALGLMVDEIVDIVEEHIVIDLVTDRPEVVGSAIVRGRAAEIVNVAHFLPLGHEDWLNRGSPPSAAARTVLLVDDSAFFRSLLGPVLKAAGYRVAIANDADEALAIFAAGRKVDVVVTDIEMPGKSGFDLIEALRVEPATADIPVIALSSYVSQSIVERARRLGVADFVAKFDRSGLIAALAEACPSYGEAA
ncbi:hybrid sensor histidine kinase/response regulator [Chelatococcus sp. SYSU_G07232]|uniref:histidine kinase n=1 Tax=Chelatococcus albus TaxID=3047466 RepID=A0ABT7AHN0_9HYPH|nr:hybrid sensor histidine kinase/response regulator [Chelatococcus sp. SYSU_G07232]MDJ1158141.1 hybrid sensor histidine kinase/response regulator [Chelatococcus sp. SYSU_G07232]